MDGREVDLKLAHVLGGPLPLWTSVSPNVGLPWRGWRMHLDLTEYVHGRKGAHVKSLEGSAEGRTLESRAQALDTVFDP